jgi:hypothetical protein
MFLLSLDVFCVLEVFVRALISIKSFTFIKCIAGTVHLIFSRCAQYSRLGIIALTQLGETLIWQQIRNCTVYTYTLILMRHTFIRNWYSKGSRNVVTANPHSLLLVLIDHEKLNWVRDSCFMYGNKELASVSDSRFIWPLSYQCRLLSFLIYTDGVCYFNSSYYRIMYFLKWSPFLKPLFFFFFTVDL